MEDRQRQITEGAGLQESRLNTEFIDWLNRWGSTILMVVLVLALSWIGWQWWQRHRLRALDDAFTQFDAAFVAGKPDNLVIVAEKFKGKGAIFELATTRAADLYLQAARRGVVPGGDPLKPEDVSTPDQQKEYLERAESLYKSVYDQAHGKPGMTIHELYSGSGLAAVAISRGDRLKGEELLQSVISSARGAGFDDVARWTERRLTQLDKHFDLPPMQSEGQIWAAESLRVEEPAAGVPTEIPPAGDSQPSAFPTMPQPTEPSEAPATQPQP